MKKKVLAFAALLVLGGVTFTVMGGMSWLDALGLRGQEQVVRQRVEGYWQARLENDLEGMADYIHPARTEIMQPGILTTEGYEIVDVAVEGEEATATVLVKSRIKHPLLSSKVRENEIEQKWVRYEGQWVQALRPMGIAETIQELEGRWTPPTVGGAETPAQAQPATPESAQPETSENAN